MSTNDFPTDPNAETIGLPTDDSGKGSVPEPGKMATQGMPSEIGRYRILGIIASGGMGVVYEAMQESPRRRVALKVIKSGAASDMALRRFDFEAQILAKLSHPNIAQIYEAGTWESESGEVPFFAMEYIAGAQGVIDYANKRDMDLRDRLALFGKVCAAVHHGHQKGIIHRDLKPDNILVDNNGEPKIIDFGVARATDADLAVTTMQTTMGQLIGTLQYMSPEQCDANPDLIDTRSDVYALGVILFQLLSNHLPYDLRKLAIHEAVRIIKDEQPITMSTINMLLKGDIETIVIKAMEKDRERRYGSAAEFASDIHHFLNNEPIIARPLSMSYQLRLFTKKYKRTCLAASACLISIVLGLAGTTWGMAEANHQKNIANEQRLLAEERYAMTVEMLTENVTDFYSSIVKLDAAMSARKRVIDKTLAYAEQLEEGGKEEDDELAGIKALTHSLQGAYYWGSHGANAGNVIKAKENYEQSFSILTDLVNKGVSKQLKALAIVQKYLGDIAVEESEYGEATIIYKKAREMIVEYISEFPDDVKAPRIKNALEQALIDTYIEMNDFASAKTEFDKQVEDRRLLAISAPKDLKLKRDYANILQRGYSISKNAKDYVSAIEFQTLARDTYLDLVEAEPENGRARRDYGWSQFFLGDALQLNGKFLDNNNQVVEALESIESGLSVISDRCLAYPEDADARDDLALYVGEYIAMFRPEFLDRISKNCLDILLALQPVVESNPTNYALAELYATLETSYASLDSAKE